MHKYAQMSTRNDVLVALGCLIWASWVSVAPAEPLVFPVTGQYSLVSHFGETRAQGRRHQGLDIAAARMTPVVAAAAGVVRCATPPAAGGWGS